MSPTAEPGEGLRGDVAYAVLAAVRIGATLLAVGIIAPLSVDSKAVFVGSGLQRDGRAPDSALLFFQCDGLLLPIGEIPQQLDRGGGRLV